MAVRFKEYFRTQKEEVERGVEGVEGVKAVACACVVVDDCLFYTASSPLPRCRNWERSISTADGRLDESGEMMGTEGRRLGSRMDICATSDGLRGFVGCSRAAGEVSSGEKDRVSSDPRSLMLLSND